MFIMHLMLPFLTCVLLAKQVSAFPSRQLRNVAPYTRGTEYSRKIYRIPNLVQNGTSKAQFDIETSASTLDAETLFTLDAPKLDSINASVFDWWYFDAVSETNSKESMVITFFSSTAAAFPFLDSNQSSVLTAWIWASFANGTVFADYVPATVATLTGVDGTHTRSSGDWFPTGLNWKAVAGHQTKYEIAVRSEKMQVDGRFTLTSRLPPHLPCGIQGERTILEIAPHLGWVNLVPDAMGVVDMKIRGSSLKFKGSGYHDKNWSDRPFMGLVESWYWGHGRLGPYSIIWFNYRALNDSTNSTYVSSYVAKDGNVLVSACNPNLLTVRPIGPGTAGRYPPRVGDVPQGFHLEYDLGEANGYLSVNVSTRMVVAGDGEYYLRWTGDMVGEVINPGDQQVEANDSSPDKQNSTRGATLAGVAAFEQFLALE